VLAIQDDHTVDDVPAENTSQGKYSAPSLIDDLGHSQTGTAGTFHDILLGYSIASSGALCLSCAGLKVFDIELISGGPLLDECKTGNTVARIGLYFEPGVGNVVPAAGTDSVRMFMDGCKRLLDPTKLVDGEQLDGQGEVNLMFRGGLVDRVGKEFGFGGDQLCHRDFVCERRSKSI
jgi:hypothetical protein